MLGINVRGILVVAALLVAFGLGMPDSQAEEPPPKPNVILILADDLDAESIAYMPNLERMMIERGTTFENAFVSNALCCPARATILRGQYTHNHQVFTNNPTHEGFVKFRDLGHESSTVATWLQRGGYRTSLIGKYLNGYKEYGVDYVPPGWNEWHSGTSYYNFSVNENGQVVRYEGPKYYSTDVFANKAVDFVGRSAAGYKPFFLYFAPAAPHTPATPARRHRDALADVTFEPPPSFNEEDVSEKPAWVREHAPLDAEEQAYIAKLYRNRLRSMLAVDQMIGRLINTLRESGELKNTYVIFTSDHGFHMGEHRLSPGKWTAYEEDIRIPLIVRGPRVPAGRTLPHLVLNNDFAPTFAKLAGTSAPKFVDGRSLVPLLGASPPPEEQWRSAFLIESAASPRYARPAFEGVRTEDRLYVEYESGEKELYDLSEDPYELENLAGQRPEVEAGLRKRLQALEDCSAASCRAAENGP